MSPNEEQSLTPEETSEGLQKDKVMVKDGTMLNESLQDEVLRDVYKSLKPLPYYAYSFETLENWKGTEI
jgi:hypothetical protein